MEETPSLLELFDRQRVMCVCVAVIESFLMPAKGGARGSVCKRRFCKDFQAGRFRG